MLGAWGAGSCHACAHRPAMAGFYFTTWKAEVFTRLRYLSSSQFLSPSSTPWLLLPHLRSPLFSLLPHTYYSDSLAIMPPGPQPHHALGLDGSVPSYGSSYCFTSLRFVFKGPLVQGGHLSNPIPDLHTSTPRLLHNSFLAIALNTMDIPNINRFYQHTHTMHQLV